VSRGPSVASLSMSVHHARDQDSGCYFSGTGFLPSCAWKYRGSDIQLMAISWRI